MKDSIVQLLKDSPLFGDLHEDKLHELSTHINPFFIKSGEVLFQENDQADAVFIVVNGRLRVIKSKSGTDVILNEIGRGELIGELALLTKKPRAATIIAIRDSTLLKLSSEAFKLFFESNPQEMLPIVRATILRLVDTNQTVHNSVSAISICSAGDQNSHAEFSKTFSQELSNYGSTIHVNSEKIKETLFSLNDVISEKQSNLENDSALTAWLSQQELDHQYVVYEDEDDNWNWTQMCLRQSDRILLIAKAEESELLGKLELELLTEPIETRKAIDLILIHDEDKLPEGTSNWLKLRPGFNWHHIRKNSIPDIQRVVRIISGNAIGLVLAGGGARGSSHIGVYKALLDLGIPVDWVGGTSSGAGLAGLIAMDYTPDTIIDRCKNVLLAKFIKIWDFTLPVFSLISGNALASRLKKLYGENLNVEDLWKNMFCIATNLSRHKIEVIRTGKLWKAVRASASLPAIFPPISNDEGDLLVDGGIVNNIPVDIMRSLLGNGKIIAVHLKSEEELKTNIPEGKLSGWSYIKMLFTKSSETKVPSMMETVYRSVVVSSEEYSYRMLKEANYNIVMDVKDIGMFSLKSFDDLVNVGYETTMKEANSLRALIPPNSES